MMTLKDLIKAWEAASWFAKAITWIGGLIGAVAGIYTWFIHGGN